MAHPFSPRAQGLYDPRFEHDACGIGFVVDAHGRRSHSIVDQAVQVLLNLEHRGACGCEKNTGDGAGILMQMPHAFLADVCGEAGFTLPGPGSYGAGLVFLPTAAADRRRCEEIVERTAAEECVGFLGWRTVPTDNGSLGATARAGEPVMRQAFFARPDALEDDLAYERKLYVLRRRIENAVRASDIPGKGLFYVPSLSHRTLVYKGMLIAPQLPLYFPDIVDPRVESALAMVHSRFSTNTFPNWARAHPYRFICHNGEINTLRGNVNWMHARESLFESKLFGDDLRKILPVVDTDGSDSAMFDNVLELLVLAGRSLPHAMMMMIPEPWAGHESMNEKKRAFYEYHSCLMEPWDGPASIAFTDGVRIGATLDRNGLRPSRYWVTKDGLVVVASEVGVLDIAPDRIQQKGRLQPGRMFLVDTEEGRIVADEEIKLRTANEKPYSLWLRDNLVTLQEVPEAPHVHGVDHETVRQRQLAFGYTREDLEQLLAPMAREGVEPVGAMGDDTPLAVLSDRPQLLYNYFKQLFAQVTNPPVDAIREEIVMAVDTTIGPERNLLEPTPHERAPDQARDADPDERGAREAAQARLAEGPLRRVGLQGADDPHPLPRRRRRCGDRARDGRGLPPGLGGHPRRHQHRRPLRPWRDRGAGAGAGAPRGGRRPPPPHPRGDANPRRPRGRERGAARDPPPRAPHRLRCGRRQPVPRVRDAPRPRPPGPAAERRRGARGQELHQGPQQGRREGDLQDGDLHDPELLRRADLRGDRSRPPGGRPLLRGHALAHRRHRRRRHRRGGPPATRAGLRARRAVGARRRRPVQVAPRRRAAPLQPRDDPPAAVRLPHRRLLPVQGVLAARRRAEPRAVHAARPHEAEAGRSAGAARGGRARRVDRAAVQDGGDVVRLHQQGGARGPGGRHEPHRRQEQHRRGRGGPGPLRARAERGLEEQRHQAGRLRTLRRDEPVPRQREGAADQDGPGGQARRGRAAARPQGLPLDREGALLDARRRPHLAAAAPRHLLDRGPRGADPRPQERERARTHQREARGRGRGRHDRRRGRQGPRRRRADQRPRRRHRRLAAQQHQARGRAVGARPRRDAPGAAPQQPAQPHRGRDGWPTQDRPRRGGGGAPRGRGVRLRHGTARRARLRDASRLPPQHVLGRSRDAGPEAAGEVRRQPRPRRELHALHRHRGARADGRSRLPPPRGDGRPERLPRDPAGHRALEGAGRRPVADLPPARRRARRRPLLPDRAGARPRGVARQDDAAGAVPAGARARRACRGHAADPQPQPRRRHDPRQRADAPPRRRGAARRHDPAHVPGLGRPELRRVPAARHHAHARGRRERLRRQGPLGRPHRRLPAARLHVRGRAEHDRRQRRALRRDGRRGVLLRRGRRALRRAQQRRARRSSRRWATTAAST